jgi:enoyl-CoA hydratase/carnithine racemase
MELILTGATISGLELSRYGLVNTALPVGEVLPKALKLASTIAAMSGPVARLAKAAILQGVFIPSSLIREVWMLIKSQAEQTPLNAGLEFEKGLYYTSFSYRDCKEGMSAFLEKRPPNFEHH